MEQNLESKIVKFALRFTGVITVLIGLIIATHTIIMLMAAHSLASKNMPQGMNISFNGAINNMGIWTILAQLAIVVWGFVLFVSANSISELIVKE